MIHSMRVLKKQETHACFIGNKSLPGVVTTEEAGVIGGPVLCCCCCCCCCCARACAAATCCCCWECSCCCWCCDSVCGKVCWIKLVPATPPGRDSRCCPREGGPGPPCWDRTDGSSGSGRAASRASVENKIRVLNIFTSLIIKVYIN